MTDTIAQPTSSASPLPGSGGRVFSGVQPTGRPHVGNHHGAFGDYKPMQDGVEALFRIVD
jgi:tryptophanyl-tRNA synthetase